MSLDFIRSGVRAVVVATLATGILSTVTAHAETGVARLIYEQKCARCHGADPGDFARRGFRRVDGRIVGMENGLELEAFLARGHGRLAPTEVAPMAEALRSLVEKKPSD